MPDDVAGRPVPEIIQQTYRRSAWPLRLLFLGSLLLPLLTAGLWGERSWRLEVARATAEASGNAELVREYALGVIRRHEAVLDAVAILADLADAPGADPDELHERLAALDRRHAPLVSLGVVSAGGQLVLSSRTHPVALDVSDRDYFRRARDGEAGLLIERLTIRPSGQDVLVLSQRRPGAAFRGAVLATIPVEAFTELFAQLAPADRGSASLMRSDGLLLVRHTASARPVMIPPDAPFRRAIAAAEQGTYRALAVSDGIERIYGYARVPGLPLYANYGVSTASIAAGWRRDVAPVAALLVLAALLGCAAVLQTARKLRAEVDRATLDAARRRAEVQDTLLRELHHRVKNSLMTVQSLIRVRGGGPDRDRVLQQRVMALAQVHDLLHVSNFVSRLDVGAFLRALLGNPAIVPPERGLTVVCEADPVEVGVDTAVPLALTVVELVTNALKHAFPEGRGGRIAVTLCRRGPEAVLTVEDDGVGLPDAGTRGRTSGLRLVDRLVGQLRGELAVEAGRGTRFTLTFPVEGDRTARTAGAGETAQRGAPILVPAGGEALSAALSPRSP
jgi:two-component sensor histidine kinase